MEASRTTPRRPVRVHGTEILASDTRQQYREKLARITLDSMVQFVGLLDPEGTVLEINKVALDAVGIEDNPEMNRFVAQCLSRDHLVLSAFDGRQGLEKALAHRPDLIVSDIMMPGMSGEQMIAELRRHPEMEETPILLLSAKADEELKIRLLEEGAQDFVTKPFAERDLLVRARNLLAVKRAQEALRDAERRKDELLATLGHELRNPLAPIRHAATMAKMRGATAAQVEWSQDVIDRQVEHMARLLDDLLEVTRITLGKLELRRERLVLQDSLGRRWSLPGRSSRRAVTSWRSSFPPPPSTSTPMRCAWRRSSRTC